ncbi:hypothetical protein GCM10010466_61200 [Planomonospora alba]|uniref:Mannosyl-glycoprotein endo-beta-N-acetylglucosamidase-like domain-containing protein n=1 Tax=Planomonospora alba TaxID=161354 RepID=A0ABP6NYN7_9ACTN
MEPTARRGLGRVLTTGVAVLSCLVVGVGPLSGTAHAVPSGLPPAPVRPVTADPLPLLDAVSPVGGTAATPATPASAEEEPGTARVRTGGDPLPVRSEPSGTSEKLRELADGSRFAVECRVPGDWVRGTVRTTGSWLRLDGGGYVPDAYAVRSAPVDRCDLTLVAAAAGRLPGTPAQPAPATVPEPAGAAVRAPAPVPEPAAGAATGSAPSWAAERAAPAGPAQFIRQVGPAARQSMLKTGVPASVTLAQAILESGWGKSTLAARDRNYFGIKCFGGPAGRAAGCRDYPTTECGSGGCGKTTASFRTYRTAADSFADHGDFLVSNSRYRRAFAHTGDPDRFAREIAKAGYATDPAYPGKLIDLMRTHDLYRYDV